MPKKYRWIGVLMAAVMALTMTAAVYAQEEPIADEVNPDFPALMLNGGEPLSWEAMFHLVYQTQAGAGAPEHPQGFARPSEISTEGLVRFICFFQDWMEEGIADQEDRAYYLPECLVEEQLGLFFDEYDFQADILPWEVISNGCCFFWKIPFSECARVENDVEILWATDLGEDRWEITARGTADGSIQVLTLNTAKGDRITIESFLIQ